MPYLQGQVAQGPTGKHCGHTSLRACPLDYLCLEPGKGLEENVLVVTDHFTQYAQAYVTQSQTAQTTTKTLWDKFIVHYGLPEKILPDQGRNFKSQVLADLCNLMGTQKLETSPYHPQTNGQCERFIFHSDWYAVNITPREEIRLEEPHWGVSPCLQLHPEFSYRAQPLLPHVWEATPPPCGSHLSIGTTLSHCTYHFKVCTKM